MNILKFFENQSCKWSILGNNIESDFAFIWSLYQREEEVIFEHSPFHILSYLAFQNILYAVSGRGFSVIIVEDKSSANIALFTPYIEKSDFFYAFVKDLKNFLKQNTIKILNISEYVLRELQKQDTIKILEVFPRSRNEVIYDVSATLELKGPSFSQFRNAKQKLLDSSKMTFERVTDNNVQDAHKILEIWNKTQGKKYEKDKSKKEQFVINKFCTFNTTKIENFIFEIGYVNNIPVSFCAMHKSSIKNDYGFFYMIKGLNKSIDGGQHGISDATYIHCFESAKKWNVNYINDGELGSEKGTSSHKLMLSPIKFIKSFDIMV